MSMKVEGSVNVPPSVESQKSRKSEGSEKSTAPSTKSGTGPGESGYSLIPRSLATNILELPKIVPIPYSREGLAAKIKQLFPGKAHLLGGADIFRSQGPVADKARLSAANPGLSDKQIDTIYTTVLAPVVKKTGFMVVPSPRALTLHYVDMQAPTAEDTGIRDVLVRDNFMDLLLPGIFGGVLGSLGDLFNRTTPGTGDRSDRPATDTGDRSNRPPTEAKKKKPELVFIEPEIAEFGTEPENSEHKFSHSLSHAVDLPKKNTSAAKKLEELTDSAKKAAKDRITEVAAETQTKTEEDQVAVFNQENEASKDEAGRLRGHGKA